MLRLALAALCVLAAPAARAFEEASKADVNKDALIRQLETGDWNARIHAVHEFDYMQEEGLSGLALATEDADWQVRMTAVHSLSSRGTDGAPILNKLLKNEPCPVVRLITLHSLGSLGPEGEEAKAMGWIFGASSKDVNLCVDHAAPGRAPWARGGKRAARAPAPPPPPPPERELAAAPAPPPPDLRPRGIPAPGAEEREAAAARGPEEAPAPRPKRPPESLPAPTKFQRHIELDALLDLSTEAAAPRRGVALEMRGRGTGAPESLPLPVAQVPREHEVSAPGLLMEDAGGAKAPHDALPDLLRALEKGDARTRARAADDLGHLGAQGLPAARALMSALKDRSPRVRSSAGLALGNIGAVEKGVVPLLTEALKDRSEDVRYAAAVALSRIDSPEARAAFNRHVDREARLAIDRPKKAR